MTTAVVSLRSLSPYTQSRLHGEPKLAGEGADAYDERTWRSKAHIEDGRVTIPAFGLKSAITDAAKYSKEQIPGQGKATWTAKFKSGIAILSNPVTTATEDDIVPIVINANADGVRGSGKRVPRRFPQIRSWTADVEIEVNDPIITEDVLLRMVVLAGKYIGIGQYRPQNGGTNGKFGVVGCRWIEE